MASIVIAGDTSGSVTISAPAIAGTPTLTLPTTSGTLVVTGGAQTVQFAAGSAASPSITFTGDTNTGIFSPAADTIAFSEGGAESMRIDSSGNVGIGTSSPSGRFHVTGGNTYLDGERVFIGGSSNNAVLNSNFSFRINIDADNTGTGESFAIGHNQTTIDNNNILFLVNDSGNVGIGTSSPSYPLHVVRNAGGTQRIFFSNNSGGTSAETAVALSNGTVEGSLRIAGTAYSGYGAYAANNTLIYNDTSAVTIMADNATNGIIKFASGGNTERMRITSGGNLLVGTTSSVGRITAVGTGTDSGNPVIYAGNTSGSTTAWSYYSSLTSGSNTASAVHFGGVTQGVNAWYLLGNGTSTWSSDINLKKNVETTRDGYIDDLCKLRVVKYNWNNNEDGTPKELGLIAQEVEKVFPNLVMDSLNPNEDGTKHKMIKGSVLPFMLLKAIQELNAKVEAQAAEIAALKGAN